MVRAGQKQSSTPKVSAAQWDRRIDRAKQLVSSYPFAAEGLRFYAHLAECQKWLYLELQKASAGSPKISSEFPFRGELDLDFLLANFPGFLSRISQAAPSGLACASGELANQKAAVWRQVLESFWHYESPARVSEEDNLSTQRFLAWIFLQPYAECLANRREIENLDGTPSTCPVCGADPIVGVLRREGDGAKKSLICMLCAHEWGFRRIYCPSCGEEREPQMAFYSAPEIPHVRVDVCDTCHTYLKSVDLTKTGLAVPIVDELATIPLDLWAREHGYEKLQTNLLGT